MPETIVNPPVFVNLLVGGTCRLKCAFCLIWKRDQPEIPAEPWVRAIRDLAAWLPDRHAVISGGEPLRHPGIFEILDAVGETGLRVSLSSSGEPFTPGLIEKIPRLPIHGIAMSVDGFSKTHDGLRGKKGLFDTVISAARRFKEIRPGLHVGTVTVINARNADELAELTDFLIDTPEIDSVNFQALVSFELVDRFTADPGLQRLWPHPYHAVGFLDWLVRRKKTAPKLINSDRQIATWRRYFTDPDNVRQSLGTCNAWHYVLTVRQNGDVAFCDSDAGVGNITANSVRDIWYSDEAEAARDKMVRCMRPCNYLINCGFEDQHLHMLTEQEKEDYLRVKAAYESRLTQGAP